MEPIENLSRARRDAGGLALVAALALALSGAACGGDEPGDTRATDGGGGTDESSETSAGTDGSTTGEDPGEFGAEEEYELRLHPAPTTPLELAMNKEQSLELFGESAKDILLIEVDTTDLLVNTLEEIKNACGTDWKQDDEDPNHDCTLTELGLSFGPNWECSAEYSMVRLLTMTPANAAVDGTSIEGLQGLADLLGVGGGFSAILAESLGIGMTEEFIDTPYLVDALKEDMLATHPNIGGDGSIMSISMWDALHDMETLGERFGPIGAHPGVLAPGFTPHSDALGPDFTMTAIASSNLRQLDGLDVDTDKEFLSIIVDTVGPTFDDPLEFDFEDPEKFSITGLALNPTVDMRFALQEHDGFVASCTTDQACWGNLPGAPVNNQSAWALDQWIAEYVVAHAGKLKYDERQFDKCYEVLFSCGLGSRVMIGPNPDFPNYPLGWAHFTINSGLLDSLLSLFNSGPPEPQYIWDLINEVGQVALHTPPGCDLAEGEADVEFTLREIGIGISGPEMSDAVRPYLQDQAGTIADLLLGNYKDNNGKVDLYYREGADGEGWLFFVHPEDQVDGAPYGYDNPGFFADAALSQKLSSTASGGAGDEVHEKLKLETGETTVYIQDDKGDVYRLLLIVPQADGAPQSIQVRVAKKLG